MPLELCAKNSLTTKPQKWKLQHPRWKYTRWSEQIRHCRRKTVNLKALAVETMLDETQKEKKNFFKNEKGIITMEVINRFKGLDLTECLKNYGRRFMTLYRGQGSRPSHMNCGKILVQFSSVAQSCLLFATPWTPHTMPGLPVHHQLPDFTQTHVNWVSDAIQQSHSLSSPFPPAFNLS